MSVFPLELDLPERPKLSQRDLDFFSAPEIMAIPGPCRRESRISLMSMRFTRVVHEPDPEAKNDPRTPFAGDDLHGLLLRCHGRGGTAGRSGICRETETGALAGCQRGPPNSRV